MLKAYAETNWPISPGRYLCDKTAHALDGTAMLSTSTPTKSLDKTQLSSCLDRSHSSIAVDGTILTTSGITFSFKKGSQSCLPRTVHPVVALRTNDIDTTHVKLSDAQAGSSQDICCSQITCSTRPGVGLENMTERAGPPRLPSAFSRGGDLQARKRSTRSPPFPILRKKSPPSTPELFQHAPSRTTTKVPQRRHQDLRNKEAISTLFIGDEDEIELMTYLEANPLTSEDLAFLLPAGTTTQSPPHGLAFSTYTEYVSVSPSPGGQPSSSIEFRREDEPSGLIDVEYKSDSTQGRFDLVLAPGFTNHGEPLDDSVSSADQGITCGGTHSSGNSTSSSKNSSSILSSSDRGRGRSSVKVSNKKTSFSRSAADRNKNKDKTGPAKPRGPKVSATKKKSPITPHANCRFVSSPFEVVKGFGQDDENDATDEEIGWNGPFGHQTSSTESKKGSSPWTSSSSLLPARRCCFSFKDWGERLGSPGFAGPPPTSNVKPIKRTAKSASTTKATILSRSPSRATIKPSLKNTREARAPALSETRPMPLTMEANHSEASALAVSLPCAKPGSLPNLVLDIPHHPFTLGPVSFGSYDGATTHEERDEEEAEYLNKEGETLSDSALDILMHAFSSDGLSDCPFMGEVPVIAHEIQERGASFF